MSMKDLTERSELNRISKGRTSEGKCVNDGNGN